MPDRETKFEIKTDAPETSSLSSPPINPATSLRSYTPARVSLRRTGVSLATAEILEFQLAHAQARDAVHATLDTARLTHRLHSEVPSLATPILTLASAAPNRTTYLRRPDLGRTLSPASATLLHPLPCDIVLVIADGLSATAIHRHAVPLLVDLLPLLIQNGQTLGPSVSRLRPASPSPTRSAPSYTPASPSSSSASGPA